jgi:hypothetical protein
MRKIWSYFLHKSDCWKYENESRIFDKPGIISCEQLDIELKAILYTTRFFYEESDVLEEINKKFYGKNLNIEKIYQSSTLVHDAKNDQHGPVANII